MGKWNIRVQSIFSETFGTGFILSIWHRCVTHLYFLFPRQLSHNYIIGSKVLNLQETHSPAKA